MTIDRGTTLTWALRAFGASLALLVVAIPAIGVLLGSVVEVDSPSAFGSSVVHWGLTLADPLVIACLWNSVALAVVVVALATLVGVGLARIARGMPGRFGNVSMTAIRVSGGCPPFLAAIGWLAIVSSLLGTAWIEANDGRRWLVLGLSQFGFASSWIAWWTSRALARIGAETIQVASLSGSPRRWIWRTMIWPLVRPTVARASASVFALLLIEPGGPIVLGIRRTIGVQIVQSSWMTSRSDLPRAAVLAGLALLITGLVRTLLLRRAGPDAMDGLRPPDDSRAGPITPPGRGRSALAIVALFGWLLIGLSPLLAIVFGAIRSTPLSDGSSIIQALAPALGSGLVLGVSASLLAMILAWPLSAFRLLRSIALRFEAVPPLTIGVGLLVLVPLATGLGEEGSPALGSLLAWLDPYRTPGILVTWGTAVALLPWAISACSRARDVDALALQDESRMAGHPLAFSRTLLLTPIGLRRCLLPTLSLALLASSSLAPGLLLAPLDSFRPMGASILRSGSFPPGGSALLPAVALAAHLLGTLLLTRSAPNPAESPSPPRT